MSPSGIQKHYIELELARDLTQKINEKAQQLVNSQIDSHKLLTNRTSITENDIIDANAAKQKTIILPERRNVTQAKTLQSWRDPARIR